MLHVGSRQRDRLLALCAGAFAASLIASARGIEDSLLADAVGAGGVPQGVGLVMLLAALALFAKSFMGAPAASSDLDDEAGMPWPITLMRTAALVLILLAYTVLLTRLGYPLSLSLLVAASGWLAGAAPRWPLWLFAALSGPGLWLLFDRLLQVRMPVGTLWGS